MKGRDLIMNLSGIHPIREKLNLNFPVRKIWKWAEIAVLFTLAVVLSAGGLAVRHQERLAEKIIRLHVIANSDTPSDQALKLRVRDAVLERADELLQGTGERAQAETLLRTHLTELERVARNVIKESGTAYRIRAEVVETDFPGRVYDGFALPAGPYLALRIVIGEGNGQNWWCVVFPPLCRPAGVETSDIPAMSETSDIAANVKTSDIAASVESVPASVENIRSMSEISAPETVLKFRTAELWAKVRQIWHDKTNSRAGTAS